MAASSDEVAGRLLLQLSRSDHENAAQLVQDILSPKQIGMTVSKPDFVFSPRNELFERLAGAIL